jgi:hypothetical protein
MPFSLILESQFQDLADECINRVTFQKPDDFRLFCVTAQRLLSEDKLSEESSFQENITDLEELINNGFDLYATNRIIDLVNHVQHERQSETYANVPAFTPKSNAEKLRPEWIAEAKTEFKKIIIARIQENLAKFTSMSDAEKEKYISANILRKQQAAVNHKILKEAKPPQGEARAQPDNYNNGNYVFSDHPYNHFLLPAPENILEALQELYPARPLMRQVLLPVGLRCDLPDITNFLATIPRELAFAGLVMLAGDSIINALGMTLQRLVTLSPGLRLVAEFLTTWHQGYTGLELSGRVLMIETNLSNALSKILASPQGPQYAVKLFEIQNNSDAFTGLQMMAHLSMYQPNVWIQFLNTFLNSCQNSALIAEKLAAQNALGQSGFDTLAKHAPQFLLNFLQKVPVSQQSPDFLEKALASCRPVNIDGQADTANLKLKKSFIVLVIKNKLNKANSTQEVRQIIDEIEADPQLFPYLSARQGLLTTWSLHGHVWKGKEVSGSWVEIINTAKQKILGIHNSEESNPADIEFLKQKTQNSYLFMEKDYSSQLISTNSRAEISIIQPYRNQ